jgi:hypothetical protein
MEDSKKQGAAFYALSEDDSMSLWEIAKHLKNIDATLQKISNVYADKKVDLNFEIEDQVS